MKSLSQAASTPQHVHQISLAAFLSDYNILLKRSLEVPRHWRQWCQSLEVAGLCQWLPLVALGMPDMPVQLAMMAMMPVQRAMMGMLLVSRNSATEAWPTLDPSEPENGSNQLRSDRIHYWLKLGEGHIFAGNTETVRVFFNQEKLRFLESVSS